ncbi:MAG TPA: nitroreductase family protein [Fimbriimonadaceae bacterium]|nr:nitroreductase family protein [Fimbriimonadaceae bacterium]
MFVESAAASWQRRYGTAEPKGIDPFAPLLRHRSVRRYEDRSIEPEVMQGLMAAAQSASTSSSLQLWSAIRISDPETRREIGLLCADQKQVHRAPEFFAFIADHRRLQTVANEVGEACEGLDYAEFFIMACIDAALAAERMVCAAETLNIGCCYIGALRNDVSGVQALLKLPSGTAPLFGLCLGYPRGEAAIKPRLGQSTVFFDNRYPDEPGIGDFDERMTKFYEEQQMSGETRWSKRSGMRVDNDHLTGREALKPWLEGQGFWRR